MLSARKKLIRLLSESSLLTVALVIGLCVVHPAITQAKKKPAKYGTIKVLTTPGGFPIEVDGKSSGETTTDYREFDLEPGLHTVVIILPDGQRWTREINLPAGRIKCLTLNYKPSIPIASVPCPYPVTISRTTSVNEGEIITFSASPSYQGSAPLHYTWQVLPATAKILDGAGTKRITVDSTGLAGQRVLATVVVDDGSGEALCRQTAQAATIIPARLQRQEVAKEFDVCCTCSYDDQKARLDNLAVELQNDPTTSAYIIAYSGRTSRVGQAQFLSTRARDYLVTHRRIDPSRIVVMNGGFREDDCVELWLLPRGATPPQATPTLQPGDARPSSTPVKNRQHR